MAVLLKPILNQILQADITEHLKAKPGDETDDRRGYRDGSYERGGLVRLSDDSDRYV